MCQKAARSHKETRKQGKNWILEVKKSLKKIFVYTSPRQHDPNLGLNYQKLYQKNGAGMSGRKHFFR